MNKIIKFTIALILVFSSLTPVYPGSCGQEVLFDSSLSTAEWSFTDANAWRTEENKETGSLLILEGASKYEPKVRSPFNIAWLENLEVSSFVMEVEARSTSREYGHRDLCFFFGKQSESEFYYVHIATAADPHANSIFLVNNQPRISIAEKRTEGTKWINGQFHKIRIERRTASGKILVYFDDMESPIMEASDRTFLSGSVGLGSFDDVGEFRNLKIYSGE